MERNLSHCGNDKIQRVGKIYQEGDKVDSCTKIPWFLETDPLTGTECVSHWFLIQPQLFKYRSREMQDKIKKEKKGNTMVAKGEEAW